MPKDFKLPEEGESNAARDLLLSRSWEDHQAVEFQDYILFPDVLLKRKADGTTEETPVMIRVPRMAELRKCRLTARAFAAEEGLDPRLDKDMCDDIETMHILTVAIRNAKPEHEQWTMDAADLEKHYDKPCLVQIWQKLDAYTTVVDPRPGDLSPQETLLLIAKLAKERHLGPLAVYGSDVQTTFIVGMANQLLSFLSQQSSLELSEPSTAA